MAASICASCLSRLRISGPSVSRLPTFILPVTAPFSTTSAQYNVLKKKSNTAAGGGGTKHRESRSARIKKKTKDRPRPPAPGERRTQKKRIVLSNTNALEISGMEMLSPENMTDSERIGQMLGLNGPLLDQLRESKSFKTTQNWSMFRQPSTLMRQQTCELGQDIKEVTESQQDQGFGAVTIQKIVAGERGSGKSIHLLQAQSMAFLNGWMVVNIPECQDFVINTSSYAPAATPEGEQSSQEQSTPMYNQPQLASQILSRIASSNTKILKSLKLIHQHPKSLPFKVSKNSNLYDLAEVGANDPQVATAIFNAFWKEITQSSTAKSTPSEKGVQRPPVLVTMDGLGHWMGPTLYHNSEHQVLHAHQFTLIRHFLSLLFPRGQTNPLASGGMVLAATSGSNTPDYPSFTTLLQQLEALQAGQKMADQDFPMPTPYSKTDQRVLDLVKHSQVTGVMRLKGLTKIESKGLLEYFAKSGVLRERVTEHFVGERWSLSGGGVIGELAKLGKRIRV